MDQVIPESMKPSFDRTAHPFYMWEELMGTSDAMRDVFHSDINEHLKKAAKAMEEVTNIHLSGCGTSYFASIAATYFYHQVADVQAQAHNSFEFSAYPPAGLSRSAVISVSHTGGTGVALDALEIAGREGAVAVGVTDVEDSALAEKAPHVLLGGGTREKPLPKTRSYVTTVLKNFLLANEVAGQRGRQEETLTSYLESSPDVAQEVLDSNQKLAEMIAKSLSSQAKIYLFGAGPNLATVMEGSLKLQESVQAQSFGFELEEGMHGPWVTMEPGDLVIVYAMEGPSFDKAVRFVKALEKVGVQIWVLSNHQGEISGADYVTMLPDVPEVISPLYGILPIYQFTYSLALSRGKRPDCMRLTDERYLDARLKLPR